MENIEMQDVKFKKLRVGDEVVGEVVSVKENVILLDINYISEGTMYLNEYSNDKIESFLGLVNVGDKVSAIIKKINADNDDHTAVYLSRIPLMRKEQKAKVLKAYEDKETVEVKITKEVNKGYLAMYENQEFFLPEGQAFTDDTQKSDIVGLTLPVRIIEIDEKRKRYVISRKAILREEEADAKETELNLIKTGDILKGTVTAFVPYGAFVKFQHVQGLLRLSQIAHQRIDKVEDVLEIGQEIEVKIIKKEGNKIDLSRKVLLKTPFELFVEKTKINDKVSGIVTQKLPFGLILELGDGVNGLLHKNEFSWNPNDNFANFVKIGESVDVSIVAIDPKKEKVSLSRKYLEENPWRNVTAKRFDKVEAKVLSIVPGKGLNVEVQGVEAFIPASELSTERIAKIEDHFAEGDTFEAVVTEINHQEWVMKLSIRRLLEQIEREQFEQYMTEEKSEESLKLGDIFKDVLKK